jgi:translation initiation factor eIF-2B subunit delta
METPMPPSARLFREVAADRVSGAGALGVQAASAVIVWCQEHRDPDERDLDDLLRQLVRLHRSHAPLMNLAARLAEAWSRDGVSAMAEAARRFADLAAVAPSRIAEHAWRRVDTGARVITWSASAAVRETLLAAQQRKHRPRVVISEARPGLEGRALAEDLARAEVETTLVLDAALPGYLESASVVMVGADAVTPDGIVNKIGTAALAELASTRQVPVVVLAGSEKFLPVPLARLLDVESRDPGEIYPDDTPYLTPLNPYFDRTPWMHLAEVISEDGPAEPGAVAESLLRIEVPPRLSRALGERR